jgi:arabinogalactan endo-1,4-beta-galactosidase
MIHRANGCDRSAALGFFDNLFERGVPTDVIGFSFYPFFHGSFRQLGRTLHEAAVRYRKNIIVVETAWGWTHENGDDCPNLITETGPVRLPFSMRGQARFLRRLARLLHALPGSHGQGFFYWEPCFIPVPGAGYALGKGDEWDNMTLFDFTGNALPSLDVFGRL